MRAVQQITIQQIALLTMALALMAVKLLGALGLVVPVRMVSVVALAPSVTVPVAHVPL